MSGQKSGAQRPGVTNGLTIGIGAAPIAATAAVELAALTAVPPLGAAAIVATGAVGAVALRGIARQRPRNSQRRNGRRNNIGAALMPGKSGSAARKAGFGHSGGKSGKLGFGKAGKGATSGQGSAGSAPKTSKGKGAGSRSGKAGKIGAALTGGRFGSSGRKLGFGKGSPGGKAGKPKGGRLFGGSGSTGGTGKLGFGKGSAGKAAGGGGKVGFGKRASGMARKTGAGLFNGASKAGKGARVGTRKAAGGARKAVTRARRGEWLRNLLAPTAKPAKASKDGKDGRRVRQARRDVRRRRRNRDRKVVKALTGFGKRARYTIGKNDGRIKRAVKRTWNFGYSLFRTAILAGVPGTAAWLSTCRLGQRFAVARGMLSDLRLLLRHPFTGLRDDLALFFNTRRARLGQLAPRPLGATVATAAPAGQSDPVDLPDRGVVMTRTNLRAIIEAVQETAALGSGENPHAIEVWQWHRDVAELQREIAQALNRDAEIAAETLPSEGSAHEITASLPGICNTSADQAEESLEAWEQVQGSRLTRLLSDDAREESWDRSTMPDN